MPKRKRTSKRSYRTRKRSRRRPRRNYRLTSMRAPSGLPIKNIVKQRYCQHITLTGSGLTPVYHVFRASSVYDPDLTGSGGQPMGFDEMAGLYNRYRVLGAKMTIKWAGNDGGAGADHMVGCYLDDSGSFPYISWEGLREARKGSSRLITHQRNAVSTSSKYSAKKFWNCTDVKDFDGIAALTSANPLSNAHFVMWMQRLDKQLITNDFNCMVQIDYIVQYFEPKDIGRS